MNKEYQQLRKNYHYKTEHGTNIVSDIPKLVFGDCIAFKCPKFNTEHIVSLKRIYEEPKYCEVCGVEVNVKINVEVSVIEDCKDKEM